MRQQQQQQGIELMATGRELALAGHGPGDNFELATVGGGMDGGGEGGGQGQVSLAHKINLLLRGRYHWALGLAAGGMLLGAAAGFFLGKPIYVSHGQIQVLPVRPKVLSADSDDRALMAFFDSFA